MHELTAPAWTVDWDMTRAPEEVTSRLKSGEQLVVTARQSGSSVSRKVIKGLHADAAQAIETLERHLGLTLPDVLPDAAKLADMMRNAEIIRSVDRDGKSMQHRVAVIRKGPVVLVLMLGTATKVTAHRQSPAAAILADIVRSVAPVLLWAKRVDRVLRHPWAVAPLMIEVQEQRTWVGDSRRGLRFLKGPEELMIFWDFAQAKEHAAVIAASSITSQREITGNRFVNGRVKVGAGRTAPAGFARVRLRDGAGLGDVVWVLDTPSAHHAIAEEAATALPLSVTATGEPADQVANIRWAFSKMGRTGWSYNRIGAELQRRGYSTDRLRSRHGADADAGEYFREERPGEILKSLLANLDLYETGRMSVKLGDGEELHIENLFPLDGPWAAPEDFERIRGTVAENRGQGSIGVAALAFTGLRCTVDGEPSVLRRVAPSQAEDGHGDWFHANIVEAPVEAPKRPSSRFKLNAAAFAELIVDALARAGDHALVLVPHDEPDDLLMELRTKIADTRQQRATAVAQRDGIDEELRGLSGYQPTGPRKQRLNDEYNREHVKVEQFDTELRSLTGQLAERRHELRSRTTPARAEQLLRMVASLRDPQDTRFREVWLKALRDVEFTTERVTIAGMCGTDIGVSGMLVVGHGEQYSIPIGGAIPSPVHARAERRVDEIVDLMRTGVPLDECEVPMTEKLRPLVARRFGADTRRFPLGVCMDARVLRIAVPLLIDARSVEAVSDVTGEPLSLVRRVADLYATPADHHTWLRTRSRVLEDTYALAATKRDGFVRYSDADALGHGRLNVTRALRNAGLRNVWDVIAGEGVHSHHTCSACGSRRLAALSIPEPAGRLCLDCRLDEDGVEWPPEPYDDFLAFPEVWRDE